MDERSGIRLAVAIAIVKSKPPELTIPEHCEQLQKRLSASQTTRSDSSNPSIPHPHDTSQNLESHTTIRALRDRIRDLELSLERSQVEADRAKLALSTHLALHPPSSNEPPPAKKKATKRKQPGSSNTAAETQRLKGKRKAGAKSTNIPQSSSSSCIQGLTSSSISLETLAEHLTEDIPAPRTQSSLGLLSSLEVFIRTLEIASSNPTIEMPEICLQSHLSRAISSISRLLTSFLGFMPVLSPLNLKSQPQSTNPPVPALRPATTRAKLRICGSALHRVLLLGNCWSQSEHNTPSATDLVVQVTKDIIVPLIHSFHVLSCRYAQELFGISLVCGDARGPTSMTSETGSVECIVDLRDECAGILVRLLDPHTQPTRLPTTAAAEQSQNTQSNTSTEFVPLSGTTATSSLKNPGDERVANCWFGDIILHLCVAEIARITTTVFDKDSQDQDGGVRPNGAYQSQTSSNPPHSGGYASLSRQDKGEVMRIVREEAIWYLCSLIHAATSARTNAQARLPRETQNSLRQREQDERHLPAEDIASSLEIVRRARDTLMIPLLADRALRHPHLGTQVGLSPCEAKNGDGQGSSTGNNTRMVGLGDLEREAIFAAVEALNECCESPWEEDNGYDTEDVDRSAALYNL